MAVQKVEFYKHNIDETDKRLLGEVLDSVFLSTGALTAKFEEKFAAYLGRNHCVGVMSATHALELALHHIGVGVGDEVVTTAMSFIATSNVVELCGATTVFVDVEADTGNISVQELAKALTPRTKAVIVVHLYGQMCDMPAVRQAVDKFNLETGAAVKIIEDCAHIVEGKRDDIKPGALAEYSCFSFYATKNIACGEGGALVVDSAETNAWLRQARLHGMTANAADRYKTTKYTHYDMDFPGWKCNLTDLQAALLYHQLDRVDALRDAKEAITLRYNQGLQPLVDEGLIEIPTIRPRTVHAWHVYTVLIVGGGGDKRDDVLQELRTKGVPTTVNYRPIHLMRYYRKKYGFTEGRFPNAEKIGRTTLTLPLYPKLTADEVEYVITVFAQVVRQICAP
eukprot:TRINITY_DN56966_c0_g1_i1.p1 TRINITY_DN56966_c0_g1~~TRINITY_DN56966_c0_g1_i1.p1  ORF type:complete len:396 (+),score=69.73 TRINITY_DN56966_c0_g1_i1:29-1216(+)